MEAGEPGRGEQRDAAYFDRWYADMAASPVRDAIVARTLGLPPELQSTSMLTWQEVLAATTDSGAAVRSLQAEGRRSLDTFESLRRVLATATAP